MALPLLAQEPSNGQISWNPRISKQRQQMPPPEPRASQKIEKKKKPPKSRFQIGGNYTYAHITPTSHSSFHGHLGGIQGLYEYRPGNQFYGAAALAWNQGNTQGEKGNRFFFKIDAQERLGYTWFKKSKNRFFSLFSGLGYRHYGHSLKTAGASLDLDYNTLYLPVGFLFQGKVNGITDLGLNFQWMPQVYPTVKLSPLVGARWIIIRRQTNFKAELPIRICIWKKHHLSFLINPSFEYWRDGHSDAKTQGGRKLNMPGNTYLFVGVDLSLGHAF